MDKLITMTDFVINLENKTYRGRGRWDEERYFDAITYAKFLKRPIKLEMFLPCDKDGNLLERPKPKELAKGVFNYTEQNIWDEKHKEAIDKLIFKNVTKRPLNEHGSFALDVDGYQVGYYKSKPNYWVDMDKCIEDLCGLDLILNYGWEEKIKEKASTP